MSSVSFLKLAGGNEVHHYTLLVLCNYKSPESVIVKKKKTLVFITINEWNKNFK